MLPVAQVRARLARGRQVQGRLLLSADGTEWIRATLTRRQQLDYYLAQVTCFGFIVDWG